jgi:hypothetical protein
MLRFAASAYCNDHPNASSCNLNSFQGDIGAIVIVAIIVALIVFEVAWKFQRGTSGPVARAFLAAMSLVARAFTPRRRRL